MLAVKSARVPTTPQPDLRARIERTAAVGAHGRRCCMDSVDVIDGYAVRGRAPLSVEEWMRWDAETENA